MLTLLHFLLERSGISICNLLNSKTSGGFWHQILSPAAETPRLGPSWVVEAVDFTHASSLYLLCTLGLLLGPSGPYFYWYHLYNE